MAPRSRTIGQRPAVTRRHSDDLKRPPGQIVLVLQGGGALGAYQAGVYEALHEADIEPDWLIGTSIGAVNAGLIAGNQPQHRLRRLHTFWNRIGLHPPLPVMPPTMPWINAATVLQGVHGLFGPAAAPWYGLQARVGAERAAFYDIAPLRETLGRLIDPDRLSMRSPRLTVGAVNARTGTMRYFDSRHEALGIDHLLASGALPPAFGAVRIDGEPYWDGGIYSNTPIEAVLDDQPRRNSTIFTVQLWNASGEEPESIWDVMAQQKEIEYSSRADSHIARQQQLHRLRHVIAELERRLPREMRRDDAVDRLCAYGCGTVMHVIRLLAPRLAHDDQTKDIDFTAESIAARWQAGLDDTRKALAAAPWRAPVDPLQGVAVHDVSARGPSPALPKGRP